MALLTQTGTYLAKPNTWGVKAEEGKSPRFAIVFDCVQRRIGAEWEPVDGEQRITGFFTLINKDGNGNEINLRALRDALGWDGLSFESLENGDWSKTEVQIVVDNHVYNGKTSLEVKYLNPRDYTGGGGGIEKAEPQTIKSLDQKYGAALRALTKNSPSAGGSTAKASVAPTIDVKTPEGAKTAAWEAFIKASPSYDPGKRITVFKKLVTTALFPAPKDPKTASAEEWLNARDLIAQQFSEQIEDLIPF